MCHSARVCMRVYLCQKRCHNTFSFVAFARQVTRDNKSFPTPAAKSEIDFIGSPPSPWRGRLAHWRLVSIRLVSGVDCSRDITLQISPLKKLCYRGR